MALTYLFLIYLLRNRRGLLVRSCRFVRTRSVPCRRCSSITSSAVLGQSGEHNISNRDEPEMAREAQVPVLTANQSASDPLPISHRVLTSKFMLLYLPPFLFVLIEVSLVHLLTLLFFLDLLQESNSCTRHIVPKTFAFDHRASPCDRLIHRSNRTTHRGSSPFPTVRFPLFAVAPFTNHPVPYDYLTQSCFRPSIICLLHACHVPSIH